VTETTRRNWDNAESFSPGTAPLISTATAALNILMESEKQWFCKTEDFGYVFNPHLEVAPSHIERKLAVFGTLLALHLSWNIGVPAQINPFFLLLMFEGPERLLDIEAIREIKPAVADILAIWPKLETWPRDGQLPPAAAFLYRSVHPVRGVPLPLLCMEQ
jgi:hypothetical protein